MCLSYKPEERRDRPARRCWCVDGNAESPDADLRCGIQSGCRQLGRERRLYNAYYTNYEIALINTWFIAKTVYPDFFEDIDITAKTNEITEMFLGEELAEAIFSCPSSFGGYQKIDSTSFFA